MLGIIRCSGGLLQNLFRAEAKRPRLFAENAGASGCSGQLALDGYGPVVIAVRAVRMVQMAIDEIVDVVPMRNCRVSAVGAVNMIVRVSATVVLGRASAGIGPANG